MTTSERTAKVLGVAGEASADPNRPKFQPARCDACGGPAEFIQRDWDDCTLLCHVCVVIARDFGHPVEGLD